MTSESAQPQPGQIVPVILSGGTGTRLWPVSRESFPKQFWPLVGDATLIQDTALRAQGAGFAPPIVICNAEHRFIVAEQLRDAGIEDASIVLEPVGRNSAAAIAVAALLVNRDHPDAVLWVMPADAAIKHTDALLAAVSGAADAARAGYIVTLGIRPTAAETGYGYIEVGKPLAGLGAAHALTRFVEKPSAAIAKVLVEAGTHLWNSGMFIASAETMVGQIHEFAPEVLQAAGDALATHSLDGDFLTLGEAAFRACPSVSIDHAVAEHTTLGAVVPVDLGWSDVGNWQALWEFGPRDAQGNVATGDVLLQDATNCLVRSDGMLTAVAGVSDVVVVVTEDAVLVTSQGYAQTIKRVVDRLKAADRPEATRHNRMYRPWGHYEGLILGHRFQVKKIQVRPGGKLSLQKHFHRAEHWVVVNGTAIVHRDGEDIMLRENESIYLPLGCIHRLENPGKIPLNLIEVQVGPYLGEDDIIRIEDTYGRS